MTEREQPPPPDLDELSNPGTTPEATLHKWNRAQLRTRLREQESALKLAKAYIRYLETRAREAR